jgi:hypothetical protein
VQGKYPGLRQTWEFSVRPPPSAGIPNRREIVAIRNLAGISFEFQTNVFVAHSGWMSRGFIRNLSSSQLHLVVLEVSWTKNLYGGYNTTRSILKIFACFVSKDLTCARGIPPLDQGFQIGK